MKPIRELTVLFDEQCALCVRIAARLRAESSFIPLRIRPMRIATAAGPLQQLEPLVQKGKFIVIADNGDVYLDTGARIMILYALKRYRELSMKMANPALRWLVDLAFDCISENREFLSSFLNRGVTAKLRSSLIGESPCDDSSCKITHDHKKTA